MASFFGPLKDPALDPRDEQDRADPGSVDVVHHGSRRSFMPSRGSVMPSKGKEDLKDMNVWVNGHRTADRLQTHHRPSHRPRLMKLPKESDRANSAC